MKLKTFSLFVVLETVCIIVLQATDSFSNASRTWLSRFHGHFKFRISKMEGQGWFLNYMCIGKTVTVQQYSGISHLEL